MTEFTPQQVLDLELPPDTDGGSTVRAYLIALLDALWSEEEGFSAKRPFGNSGWQYDVYLPMIRAGMIDGQIDGDGYVDRCDVQAADRLILAAIAALGEVPSGVTAREVTAIGLINAIRDLPVMVSHTGPPADREVAEEIARMILDRLPGALPEAEPAGLNSAESVTVSRADFQAILHFARVTGQKTKSQRALVDRLAAAVEPARVSRADMKYAEPEGEATTP